MDAKEMRNKLAKAFGDEKLAAFVIIGDEKGTATFVHGNSNDLYHSLVAAISGRPDLIQLVSEAAFTSMVGVIAEAAEFFRAQAEMMEEKREGEDEQGA
jgi:hypothetical protein